MSLSHVGTLWGHPHQRQTKVILSVASLNELELAQPAWSFQDKPAEFTDKFEYGKIPAFEGTDGFKLVEGAPIARYLSSIGTKINLLGSNEQEAAIVDQWVHFAEHEIGVPTYAVVGLVYGFVPFDREAIDKSNERIIRAFKYVESHLATRTRSGYVALDSLSLADFVLAGVVLSAASLSLGSAERAEFPLVFAHYARVTEDERVRQFWGTNDFVDVRVTEPRKLPSS